MKYLLLLALAGAALLWLRRWPAQPRSAPSSGTGREGLRSLGKIKLPLFLLFEVVLLLAVFALFKFTFSLFLRLVIIAVAVGLSLMLFGYLSKKKTERG